MPLSRSFKIASLGALWAMLSSASGWANEPAPATSQCTGCHQGALALDKFNADELTEKIKGMLADPAGHPPLQITDKSDAAIAALAKALAGSD